MSLCNILSHETMRFMSALKLLHEWRFIANQFVLATNPLRLTTSNFMFQLKACSYSPYVTSSLTRGWICRLQLLLVLASSVILMSESHETHDQLLLSQIQGSPTWTARSRYLYPPVTGWLGFTPGKGFPFHCLLRLAGLRWRNSIQSPHRI
jgi:hypothetical protein